MKKLLRTLLILPVLLASVTAIAQDEGEGDELSPREVAVQAFEASEDVQVLLDKAEENGLIISEEIDTALIFGMNGIMGPSSYYFVTQSFKEKGPNAQTTVVAALVSAGPLTYTDVRLIDVDELAALIMGPKDEDEEGDR